MRTTQASSIQSLHAVKDFLDANADKLGGVVKSGYRQKVDDVIATLAGHVVIQSASVIEVRGSTRTQRALRKALVRDHMVPIARIAKAELQALPALEALRMPARRIGVEKLAAAAEGMAQAAPPYAGIFVAGGLPVDFAARLNAAAGAMRGALRDRTQKKAALIEATNGLRAKLSEGRKAVHVLDALIQGALVNDPALLAAWDSIKRVQLVRGGHPKATEPAAMPTVAASEPV